MAHLVIHSMLHCQGFDHMTDEEAAGMEALEILLLSELESPIPTVNYKITCSPLVD